MTRRKSSLVLIMIAVVALVVGACSSPDESDSAPVTINLPDGRSVDIPQTPTRIVTLGGQWTDVALSFGITPVGYYDAQELQTGDKAPWFGEKLNDSALINPQDDLVGSVAKLEPDLILAPGFASMSEEFDKMSDLAPTIDKISGAQIDPWQDMVTLMGTILHEPEKAKEIIAGVDDKINALAEEFPGVKGKTYTFAYLYGSDQISVLGDEADGSAKLFTQLGLTMSPKAVAQTKKSGQPRFQISTENIDMLDSDILIAASQTPKLQARVEGLPGYKSLTSVGDDAVVMLTTLEITGLNEPSPSSIPYTLDKIKPALQAAADAK